MTDRSENDSSNSLVARLVEAETRLALAYRIAECAQVQDSALELFECLKEEVKADGGFLHLLYFVRTDSGYILSHLSDAGYSDLLLTDSDEPEAQVAALLECPEQNVISSEIAHGDRIYGLLVGVTKEKPKAVTYTEGGILSLFASFLTQKAIEQHMRRYRAFAKALSEASVLLHEHLVLHRDWLHRAADLLDRCESSGLLAAVQGSESPSNESLSQFRKTASRLEQSGRTCRSVLDSFVYLGEQTPIRQSCWLDALLADCEVGIERPLKTVVYVDRDHIRQSILILKFVGRRLSRRATDELRFRGVLRSRGHARIRLTCESIGGEQLAWLGNDRRDWERDAGAVVSGPDMMCYDLARRLIRLSNGSIEVESGKPNDIGGFVVSLPLAEGDDG